MNLLLLMVITCLSIIKRFRNIILLKIGQNWPHSIPSIWLPEIRGVFILEAHWLKNVEILI